VIRELEKKRYGVEKKRKYDADVYSNQSSYKENRHKSTRFWKILGQ